MDKASNEHQAPPATSFGADINLFFENFLKDSEAKHAKLVATAEHFTSAAKTNDQDLTKLLAEKTRFENEYIKLSIAYKAKVSELDDTKKEAEKYKSQYLTYKTHRDALKIEIPGLEQEVKFANSQLTAMKHQVTSISSELANTKSQLKQTRELLGEQAESGGSESRRSNFSNDELDALKGRNRELEEERKILEEEITKKDWANAALTAQRRKSIENNDATNARLHERIDNLGKELKVKHEEFKSGSIEICNDLQKHKEELQKHKDLVKELKGDKQHLETDKQRLEGNLRAKGRENMILTEKAKKDSDCDKKIMEALRFKIKYLEGKLKDAENGKEEPREVVTKLDKGAAVGVEGNSRKRSLESPSVAPVKVEEDVKYHLDELAAKKSRSV
ncbi:hypothetical protein B0J14DRAFT_660181 [Halenospora varia]|nr:hypothetical protein B0J14DRAFT_660181 [Halenospora varia]